MTSYAAPVGASAWCHTSSKTDTNFCFAWTIEKFGQKMETFKKGEFLTSGNFNVGVEGVNTVWNLRCYPKSDKREVEDSDVNVSIYLFPLSTAAKDIKGKITFTAEIVNRHGSHEKTHVFIKSYEEIKKGFGFPNFISPETLNTSNENLLPRGSLTFFCTLKFAGSDLVTMKSIPPLLDNELNQEDNCGMLELLQTGDLADVEVVCGGRHFLCHKSILGCKSPVFRAAFLHNMKENSSGKFTIQDFDPQTVEDMLAYIYGGKIEGLEDKAGKLLAIADKYDLKQLKAKCEALLASCLNVGNCLDSLILADLHSSVALKPFVIKFMVENSKEVVTLEDWKEKFTSFPELFIEVWLQLQLQPRPYKMKK